MNKETGMANNLEISSKEKLRETVRKNISDRIDTYIASTPGMTQYKFADMTGASRSSVNRWLNKKGNEMPKKIEHSFGEKLRSQPRIDSNL